MGESEKKVCPIVSVSSEVKSTTGYPRCIDDHCAWWTGSDCAVKCTVLRAIAERAARKESILGS